MPPRGSVVRGRIWQKLLAADAPMYTWQVAEAAGDLTAEPTYLAIQVWEARSLVVRVAQGTTTGSSWRVTDAGRAAPVDEHGAPIPTAHGWKVTS